MGTTRRVNARRAHGLDGLRGLAALGILVLHVWMYTQANDPTHNVLVDRVIGEFRTGVELFFVLSAFLLAAPWVAASRGERPAPHLGRFAIRRATRIVPGYLVALIGSLLLLHGTGHPRDIGLGDLPLFLLFIPNLVPATRNMLDPPMWTMHVEVSFYLALPLIGWAITRLARRWSLSGPLALCAALIGASVAWVALSYSAGWEPEVTWTLPTYLGAFACGIGAAILVHGRTLRPDPRPGPHARRRIARPAQRDLAQRRRTGAAGAISAISPHRSASRRSSRPSRCGRRGSSACAPLRVLGAISLGVYLWHMPVLYALQVHDLMPETFWAALPRVLVPALALAGASWVLVERPALRWSARYTRRSGRVRPRTPVAVR